MRRSRDSYEGAAFDGWAEYYDLIHDGLPGDVAFYVEEALRAGGEVLEVGVGTGRIAISEAIAGVRVTGLDDSASMLALCGEKARRLKIAGGRLTLVQGDMRAFDLARTFPLVTMPYRTFMHLLTEGEQKRCLLAIRRHMAEGGLFVFDTWHPVTAVVQSLAGGGLRRRMKLVERYAVAERGIEIMHYARMRCDPVAQVLSEEHLVREVDGKGEVRRELTLPLVRAWTTRRELEDLVAGCGFEVQAVYGDFDKSALRDDSTEMVWVLRKGRRGRGGAG